VLTFHPLSNTLILVRAMAGALLGGLTSLSGAFVGGLTVGVVESLVQWQTPISGVPDAAIFALILGTLLVRPRGLWGTADA
jgi:branched-chain amino acid transport system permease protein